MPLTRAAPVPRELTRILLKAVLRFGVTAVATRLARKETVLPGLRFSVPRARVAVAPWPEPSCELMNDAPLFRVIVPKVSAVGTPGVLLARKLSVALFRLTFAGFEPERRRPDKLVPVLSRVRVVPALKVTSAGLCIWI